MALQDLTPQLRTRLSRMERAVGLFMTLAVVLFVLGFGYYLYQTGQNKGWFLAKMRYYTYVDDASGLEVGDDVMLMGFKAGKITEVTAMPAFANYNVYVAFEIHEPYFGYMWKDSRASVAPANLLGDRVIEVTKGTNPYPVPSYIDFELRTVSMVDAFNLSEPQNWAFNDTIDADDGSNYLVRVFQPVTRETLSALRARGSNEVHLLNRNNQAGRMTAIYVDQLGRYTNFTDQTKGYMLPPDESPALTERAEEVFGLVMDTLPNIFNLTNRLQEVLTNTASLTARADTMLQSVQPAASNLVTISAMLREPDGSLGRWLLPVEMRHQISNTLATAQITMAHADHTVQIAGNQIQTLSSNLTVNLIHLAGITSNLNAQVQANDFILTDISDLVRATDDLVQGLKRHWLLKGAFDQDDATRPLPSSMLNPSLGNPAKAEPAPSP